ncbi:hypothetical protein NDN01_06545 [Sphingomonas sp. QA11]|uniref:hypothetical protein n=1 Tax=Sphingomonas sp. QA11 TaxID=2950605 RepID=UPI0023495223|nr:hypothetical protein [Sphingomonas sp. QA11]WCM28576.1 hypothetical protein NDN01_06545 [Sphingomonas sp. QA11]
MTGTVLHSVEGWLKLVRNRRLLTDLLGRQPRTQMSSFIDAAAIPKAAVFSHA